MGPVSERRAKALLNHLVELGAGTTSGVTVTNVQLADAIGAPTERGRRSRAVNYLLSELVARGLVRVEYTGSTGGSDLTGRRIHVTPRALLHLEVTS